MVLETPAVYGVFVVAAAVILFAVAAVAAGRGGSLADPVHDRVEPRLPECPLEPGDVENLRFAVVVRGYRMDQVDAVLDRLGAELARRDERIAALTAQLAHSRTTEGPQP